MVSSFGSALTSDGGGPGGGGGGACKVVLGADVVTGLVEGDGLVGNSFFTGEGDRFLDDFSVTGRCLLEGDLLLPLLLEALLLREDPDDVSLDEERDEPLLDDPLLLLLELQ